MRHRWLACVFLLLSGGTLAAAPAPVLKVDDSRPAAGFFHLDWQQAGSAKTAPLFELQVAHDPLFHRPRLVYRGPHRATARSGYPNGDYYFRVRLSGPEAPGPWSNQVHVRVAHHALSRALGFLFAGALVFLLTVFLMIRGLRSA